MAVGALFCSAVARSAEFPFALFFYVDKVYFMWIALINVDADVDADKCFFLYTVSKFLSKFLSFFSPLCLGSKTAGVGWIKHSASSHLFNTSDSQSHSYIVSLCIPSYLCRNMTMKASFCISLSCHITPLRKSLGCCYFKHN